MCSLWSVTSELKHLKRTSDYSYQFGIPASAKRVIQKSAKQFRKTGNVNILKCVRWLSVVTETRTREISDRLSETLHKSLWKLAQQTGMLYDCCCRVAKTLQLFPNEVHVIQQLLQLDCEK